MFHKIKLDTEVQRCYSHRHEDMWQGIQFGYYQANTRSS